MLPAMSVLLLRALSACVDPVDGTGRKPDATSEVPAPRCGDGAVDADEACDDGDANDDAAPDACRTSCLLPSCGDGVVDAGEACDDGGVLGGDGCDGACAAEAGTLEVEENDEPATATAVDVTGGARVHGSLGDRDTDCYSFQVPRCGAVSVTQAAPCGTALGLSLYDPDGNRLAVGAPGEDGCAALDPADQPGARWVAEGAWAVCAEPYYGELLSYALDFAVVDAAALDADAGADLDRDGEPDSCDLDRDGDGVDDVADNCPEVSNGPETELALSADGFVRTWLGAGPFTGDANTGSCRPAEAARVGEGDDARPAVGEPAGDAAWEPFLLTSDTFDLYTPYGSVSAPREAYAAVYLWSDTARTATLAVGADDGVFTWWNAELVLDVASCQGVNRDQFQASVEVLAGWNQLLLKVYDQGGAWGLSARLFDETGAPVTDLRPGLDPEGAWLPDQTDTDGDGVGDVCE